MAGRWIGSDASERDGFRIERDLLCTVDSAGYFTSLNSGWERVLGWTREELMSRPLIDFVHPGYRGRTVDELAQVSRPERILVVGAGPVGHSLAKNLEAAGYALRHWSREGIQTREHLVALVLPDVAETMGSDGPK